MEPTPFLSRDHVPMEVQLWCETCSNTAYGFSRLAQAYGLIIDINDCFKILTKKQTTLKIHKLSTFLAQKSARLQHNVLLRDDMSINKRTPFSLVIARRYKDDTYFALLRYENKTSNNTLLRKNKQVKWLMILCFVMTRTMLCFVTTRR